MSLPLTQTKQTSIWKNKSFAILVISTFLISVANKIYELLLPLIIYELTHSPVAVSSMRTAELLPNLLFGIFIGVIVDRVQKRKWAMWMVGGQALLLLAMVQLIRLDVGLLFPYYVIGFLLMTLNYGYFNAQVSLTKLTVPREQMTSANAKFSFIETFVGVMGPVISGLILLLPFLYDGILITALAYFLCFVLLTQLTSSQESFADRKKSTFTEDFLEGWKSFRGNKPLWLMTIFIAVMNCSMTVVSTTAVIYAKEELAMTSAAVASIMAFAGIGGLAGSLIVNKLRQIVGLGIVFGTSSLIFAIAYIGMFFAHDVKLLAVSLFLSGFALALYTVSAYTFRLEQTPAELIGRISGITGTLFRVGMPLTMYVSGWMVLWWGADSVFLSSAFLNIVVYLIFVRTILWQIK
ncbi:MFS transporter [Neobacillus muris]|uniref:MFS transporter n=1 Tax=Neobacillus muris TaxID=2941334 RepID=UPI0020406B5E|nr:MFS transporter [Neobacillus muris]